jgi:hypothetical protein
VFHSLFCATTAKKADSRNESHSTQQVIVNPSSTNHSQHRERCLPFIDPTVCRHQSFDDRQLVHELSFVDKHQQPSSCNETDPPFDDYRSTTSNKYDKQQLRQATSTTSNTYDKQQLRQATTTTSNNYDKQQLRQAASNNEECIDSVDTLVGHDELKPSCSWSLTRG